MYSSLGEYIQFLIVIDPFNRETNEVRNVEDWLSEVETQMRDSLRDLIKRGSAAYSKETRKDWIFQWPSQIILTLDQVLWTTAIEVKGIKKMENDSGAMKKAYLKEEAKL